MTAVFFDTNALYIEGYRDSFVAGSLVADVVDGAEIGIRVLHGGARDFLNQAPWQTYTRQDGTGFGSLVEAKAYLDGEFAKRRPLGDRVRISIDIAQIGQSLIPLQDPPVLLSSVRLIVNGLEYTAPDIAASSVAVTWLNTDFALSPSDRVTLAYS